MKNFVNKKTLRLSWSLTRIILTKSFITLSSSSPHAYGFIKKISGVRVFPKPILHFKFIKCCLFHLHAYIQYIISFILYMIMWHYYIFQVQDWKFPKQHCATLEMEMPRADSGFLRDCFHLNNPHYRAGVRLQPLSINTGCGLKKTRYRRRV